MTTVWREMKTYGYYRGQKSCSEAEHFHLAAYFRLDIDMRPPEYEGQIKKSYCSVRHSIGGDIIDEMICYSYLDGLEYLKKKIEEEIEVNRKEIENASPI
jgi:hypothetical protein